MDLDQWHDNAPLADSCPPGGNNGTPFAAASLDWKAPKRRNFFELAVAAAISLFGLRS
jgi:hypothetical protein